MKIMFIGLGLIGGSMALALEGYPNLERYAVDGDEPTRLEALGRGVVPRGMVALGRCAHRGYGYRRALPASGKRRRILSADRRAESSPVRC